MRNIRALLFDLDGTLADTAEANYLAYAAALAEASVMVDRESFIRAAHGRNWREFLPGMLADRSSTADPAQIAARKRELYPEHIRALRLNDGLLSLAYSARPAKVTGLVTTASRTSVEAIFDHHKLAPLFDVVITGDEVEQHKPHPAAYQLALERLGVDPAEALTFEDSDIGEQSARAAGITVVRITL